MTKTKQSFEAMTNELEEILLTLERGEKPLEEMLKLYARGVELTGLCRAKLNAAEEVLQAGASAQTDGKGSGQRSDEVCQESGDTLF